MTLNEVVAALKTADDTPNAALQVGVTMADDLAPLVYQLADKLMGGVYLLPGDNKLLFYGLHVLAAAHHRELCGKLLKLLHLDEAQQDNLFPNHVPTSLTRLLLTVWQPGIDELQALMLDDSLTVESRWAAFDILARRTFDGRILREDALALLTRIEREDLIDQGDMGWWGWEEAVRRLGLTQLEPALRRVWTKAVNVLHTDDDHADSLEGLNAAAANPADPSPFDDDDVRAIDDPVEAVAWVTQQSRAMEEWAAARNDAEPDDDPARNLRLTRDERDWLASFLVSSQAPDTTMNFEMLDGLLTALVIGPTTVPTSEFLPLILATEVGEGPEWDTIEQADYFTTLVTKHWNAIATRRDASARYSPFILPFSENEAGRDWASGFVTGIELRATAWEPILRDPASQQLLMPILALAVDDNGELGEDFDETARRELIDRLPELLQMVADFWRSPVVRRTSEPNQSFRKVGRNESCPCGSGRKFKRCCGLTPPTLH